MANPIEGKHCDWCDAEPMERAEVRAGIYMYGCGRHLRVLRAVSEEWATRKWKRMRKARV